MAANRKDIRTAQNGVSLEHRHFAFIAATLAGLKPQRETSPEAYEMWRDTVGRFTAECAGTNPRFNRDRFRAACLAD